MAKSSALEIASGRTSDGAKLGSFQITQITIDWLELKSMADRGPLDVGALWFEMDMEEGPFGINHQTTY